MISLTPWITALYPRLNASTANDLIWWTDAELRQWAEEALKNLARECGLFTERNELPVFPGGAAYSLPARQISIIHLSLTGRPLRFATVRELEALNRQWQTAQGAVERYTRDVIGLGTITLYRLPAEAAILALLYHETPASIEAVRCPKPVADYFTYAVLGEARAKQGDAAMPEVAAHARERAKLLEAVIRRYWGGAQ